MSEPSFHLRWNALQLQGRRERQEDAWCVRHRSGGESLLALIADGLGGHPEGDHASRSTVLLVADAIESADAAGFLCGTSEARALTMRQSFIKAHEALREYAADEGYTGAAPATTLIAVRLDSDGLCTVAGVGDSLVWRLRQHRLDPVLVPQGEGSWVEFSIGSRINEGRAVQVEEFVVRPGDRLILATDGIDTVPEPELRSILESPLDLVVARLAARIHEAARVMQDNVTVVLIEVCANEA